MNTFKFLAFGLTTGLLNGLFGAGGGMALIPLLKMQNLEEKECHGTCVAVILALSLVSIYTYYQSGHIDFTSALPYIPYGVIGAFIGAFLMKKISTNLLRYLFAVLMLIFGVRLLMR